MKIGSDRNENGECARQFMALSPYPFAQIRIGCKYPLVARFFGRYMLKRC
jgi:hypothetical protein